MSTKSIDTAYLILLEVLEGTEVGIDWKYWNVGPRFRGIKAIPPGAHFIYYSAVNGSGDTAPRTGFFHSFTKGEFLVKQWNRQTEDFDDRTVSPDELSRYMSNIEELESHLGPYPMENYKTWVSLSNWIDVMTLNDINPAGRITSVCQFESTASNSAQRLKQQQSATCSSRVDAEGLPLLALVPDSLPRFTEVPERAIFPTTTCLTGSHVSKHSIDRSYTLNCLLAQRDRTRISPQSVLGEVQYAFLCFLLGNLMEGLEQWRRIIDLLCRCEDAIVLHPTLYTALINVLYHQIQVISPDLFTDIVTQNNFLVAALHSLFRNMESADVTNTSSGLKVKVEGLKLFLKKKFGWEFSGEMEDEMPVVVMPGDTVIQD